MAQGDRARHRRLARGARLCPAQRRAARPGRPRRVPARRLGRRASTSASTSSCATRPMSPTAPRLGPGVAEFEPAEALFAGRRRARRLSPAGARRSAACWRPAGWRRSRSASTRPTAPPPCSTPQGMCPTWRATSADRPRALLIRADPAIRRKRLEFRPLALYIGGRDGAALRKLMRSRHRPPTKSPRSRPHRANDGKGGSTCAAWRGPVRRDGTSTSVEGKILRASAECGARCDRETELLINNRQGGRRRGRGGQRPQGMPGNVRTAIARTIASAAMPPSCLKNTRALARDAQLAGDRVQTEYYLQFADHYFRVLEDGRSRFEEQNQRRRRNDEDEDDDEDNGSAEDDDEDGDDEQQPSAAPRPQSPGRTRSDRSAASAASARPQRPSGATAERTDRATAPRATAGARRTRPERAPRPERTERSERPARPRRERRMRGRRRGAHRARRASARDRRQRRRRRGRSRGVRPAAACASRATTTAATISPPRPDRRLRSATKGGGRRPAALFRVRKARPIVTKLQRTRHDRVAPAA